MTIENFCEAEIIVNKIKKKKDFLKYFTPQNDISIFASEKGRICTLPCNSHNMDISDDIELIKLIRSYIQNQISDLEKKLEEL